MRVLTVCTAGDSMSSANPSNDCPSGVRKRIAPSARRWSLPWSTSVGRYHATTFMCRLCADWISAAAAAGRTNASFAELLPVSR